MGTSAKLPTCLEWIMTVPTPLQSRLCPLRLTLTALLPCSTLICKDPSIRSVPEQLTMQGFGAAGNLQGALGEVKLEHLREEAPHVVAHVQQPEEPAGCRDDAKDEDR